MFSGWGFLAYLSSLVYLHAVFPHLRCKCCVADDIVAVPFVNNLAQRGILDYPFFGLSLAHNDSGTLTIGSSHLMMLQPALRLFGLIGAIDGGVVKNGSEIEWHSVVPFSPFGAETNTSRYLQWAIELTEIFVGLYFQLPSLCRT